MTTEFGVWSDAAGGFIDGPLYSEAEAIESLAEFKAQGEDDAKVLEWHDEDEDEDDE